MLEISRTAVAEGDDEIELTLDLSIGGSYGKSQKNEEEKRGNEIMVPRSGFSFSETSGNDLENISGSEAMDSKRKREIQALRRQEARKKREEKMRKSGAICRKIPNGSAILSANADDKLQLKLQQFKAKTRERETRENELASLLQSARKNDKIDEFAANNSLKELMQQKQNSCRKGRQSQQAMSNEFLERSSSVVSDHPSTSGKGGSSSECLKADELLLRGSATSGQSDKPNENDTSSSSKETDRATTRISSLGAPSPKASKTTSASKLQGGNHGMDSLATMPCVSTTGNGPSGKTINGFLYRYSKTEVSIVCVCHGKSHTPAEFVEHAGGVAVTNPLRHITMIPSSFG